MTQRKTPTQLLIEAKLAEPLAALVNRSRRSGLSWGSIARIVYERTEVEVTSESLRNWYGATAPKPTVPAA